MSQQIRAAQLLREAANLLQSPVTTVTSTVPPSTGTTSTSSTPAVQAIRSLFGPYNRRSYGRRGGRVEQPEKRQPVSYWTHKFAVIPRCKQETVPNREEKYGLYSMGFGEKRLTMVKSTNSLDFTTALENAFPKLKAFGYPLK
ncbi:uncharacterized protein LOC128221712 [Mya arenaria]|uniref:uncharacterized protein LOC128221712 n=1 Tax=Mya arenaria TaxID=6604 RepID=UPI0022E66E95|nr:uncharacterized protein LOC128221712 [Mya arenaria]